MAVTWIGDTINTPLKTKYDTALSKINVLKDKLHSKGLDVEFMIADLHNSLNTITNNSLKTVSVAVDKTLSVANCFTTVDPKIKNKFLNAVKNTINKILNGEILNTFIEKIQEIIDNIDNIISKAIAAVSNTIKTIEEAIKKGAKAVIEAVNKAISKVIDSIKEVANNISKKINDALSSISDLDEAIQKFSQAMSKAAAFINCLEENLIGDTKLGENIEKIDTNLKGVTSTIRQVKSMGKDKSTILRESNMVIASNLKLQDKYANVADKLNAIV